MAQTVAQFLVRLRDILDEQTESSWTNAQLRRWANDGLDDIARETRQLKDTATFATVASQAEYTLASNILEVEFVYFTTSDGRLVPLDPVPYSGADQVWGQYQNNTSYQPVVFTLWGFSPTLKMRLYPVPTSINTITMKVSRLAAKIDETGATDSATIDFPEGWIDTLVDYAEYRALRKDRDPRWQEAYNIYLSKRDSLKMASNLDVPDYIGYAEMNSGLPAWLTDYNWRG